MLQNIHNVDVQLNYMRIEIRNWFFVATVATDIAVFVATLPVEYQSLTVNHFSFTW